MPRPQRFTPDRLGDLALPQFWRDGYGPTSLDDLVRITGASRHAIYSAAGDKRGLLMESLAAYRRNVVDPAFGVVEQPGARLAAIAVYFETQIAAAEAAGLPSQGCLLANLMTEVAPHDEGVADSVRKHLDRLRGGFARALENAGADPEQAKALAELLTITAQGLWSASRVMTEAAPLRAVVSTLLGLIEGEVGHD